MTDYIPPPAYVDNAFIMADTEGDLFMWCRLCNSHTELDGPVSIGVIYDMLQVHSNHGCTFKTMQPTGTASEPKSLMDEVKSLEKDN